MADLPAVRRPSSLAKRSAKTIILWELLNSLAEGFAHLEGEPMEMLEDWSSQRIRELWEWLMAEEGGGTLAGQRELASYLISQVVCARQMDYAEYQAVAAEFSRALEPMPGYTIGVVPEATVAEYSRLRQAAGCPITPSPPSGSFALGPLAGIAIIAGGMIAAGAILKRVLGA
jgi:hypothetical protein